MMLLALFACVSCSKENHEKNPIEEQIIGTWDATHVFSNGNWVDVSKTPKLQISATFKTDGSYYGQSEILGTGYGTYKVEGKMIKTYIDKELYLTYSIISIEAGLAEITISDGGDSLRFRFKKR